MHAFTYLFRVRMYFPTFLLPFYSLMPAILLSIYSWACSRRVLYSCRWTKIIVHVKAIPAPNKGNLGGSNYRSQVFACVLVHACSTTSIGEVVSERSGKSDRYTLSTARARILMKVL